ncbi:tungstate transport system substrate-binding protein [Microdochium nivale]|nr:tungstate transport system substrate-binding protein [Microdochium nivale]
MAPPTTAIASHGELESKPKAVYGSGKTILRIGNGGAGATGLLEVLCLDYLSTLPEPASISWVANHSRHTQLALLHDYIDIAMTYERSQEAVAEAEGWSTTHGPMFHDHFCIVGPVSDPADVRSARSPHEALAMIARARHPFHSRREGSATMYKEEDLWRLSSLAPWQSEAESDWFQSSHLPPAEALIGADRADAYLVTDRSTLLRQVGLGTISNSTVFFEPTSQHHYFMNSCFALSSPHAPAETKAQVARFLEYLSGPRGQRVVADYSIGDGWALFATLAEKRAERLLGNGRPKGGRWVMPSAL